MITFRTELQLLNGTTVDDIWNGFCAWREKAKHSTRIEKIWFSQNSNCLKTRAVQLKSKHEESTIKTFIDKSRNLMLIQYIQEERRKTFITTIIMSSNSSSPVLSYTMEETPFSIDEFRWKKNIRKPEFFYRIDSFIDKKYVPCDFRGSPISFAPSIFVSKDISEDCYEYLCKKFEHTANIRLDNKKTTMKKRIDASNSIDMNNVAKKSSAFIAGKRNMDFVDWKVTWNFIIQKLSEGEIQAFNKAEIVNENDVSPVEKKEARPKQKNFIIKKKIFPKNTAESGEFL